MELTARPQADRRKTAKSPQRSRAGNGRMLNRGDLRGVWFRHFKDCLDAHLSEIPNASYAEGSILRRASVLEVELETMETTFATRGHAEPDELDLYQRTAGNLRRLLESVGLQRRSLDVTPTLSQYLEQHAPATAPREAAE
jgi:hypothetical protein